MRRGLIGAVVVAIAGLGLALPAGSKAPRIPNSTPQIFTNVVQCRSIADSAQRLACFDRAVAALAEAQAKNDLFVADREAMREARRGLFGFNLPKMRIFADDDMDRDVDQIESTIAAVASGQRGVIIVLKDGGRWAQTDGAYMDRPKVGAKIKIKRALLGSYFASIEGKPGFRIERLNN